MDFDGERERGRRAWFWLEVMVWFAMVAAFAWAGICSEALRGAGVALRGESVC